MKKFLAHLVLLALVVYYALPNFIEGIAVTDYRAAIIAAILFGFINIAIKPVINIITLPLNFLTLGMFGLAINVFLFWFVSSIITGFSVATITAAILGALVMTIANWVIEKVLN